MIREVSRAIAVSFVDIEEGPDSIEQGSG